MKHDPKTIRLLGGAFTLEFSEDLTPGQRLGAHAVSVIFAVMVLIILYEYPRVSLTACLAVMAFDRCRLVVRQKRKQAKPREFPERPGW